MRKQLIFTLAAALLGTTTLQAGPAQALPGNLSGLRDAVPADTALYEPVKDGRRTALGIGLGLGLLGGALLSQRHYDRYDYYPGHYRHGYYADPYYHPQPRRYYYYDYDRGRADDSGHPNRRRHDLH